MERATFFDRLRQSRLLSETECEQTANRFHNDHPTQDIADALVKEGVLTSFQAQQVCGGDTQLLSLGQYRLLDELGRGGMGRVYKALHTIMGRVVAVKVISPELVRNRIAVEWFRREVRASTQLVHPNIVMAYDANEADGMHFLVMEYVEGVTLDAFVKEQGPLPVGHACALMRQAALGLQYAHEKGMVHRDIKPCNLLLPRPGGGQAADVLVKIVDFGLARLHGKVQGDTIALRTEATVLGTPDYISPEQSRDIHAADIRSDLYSLGCTFYYALAGRVPFAGETAMEKLVKHLMDEPEPLEAVRPEIPPAVIAIVRRLMAKQPAERYQTPAELVRELDAFSAERPEGASATPIDAARPAVASKQSSATKVLPHIESFTPSPEAELSGPSLFEPTWKHAPGAVRSDESHDTVSLSRGGDTGAVSPSSVKPAASGRLADSDSTLEEVRASAAALPELSEVQRIDPVLRRHWRRWTALLEIIIRGSGPSRVSGDAYRAAHADLLHTCRLAVESTTPDRRAFYQELVSIVQPWFNLQTFVHTEAQMLDALLQRCKQAELELNDGKVPWTVRQGIGLALLLLSPIAVALWYWNSARLWLPSLMRSFSWDSPASPSPRSAWSYIEAHPSLLMGVVFPVVIVFSIYLLSRTPRT